MYFSIVTVLSDIGYSLPAEAGLYLIIVKTFLKSIEKYHVGTIYFEAERKKEERMNPLQGLYCFSAWA